MKLIDKIYTISWDGENKFKIVSMDKTINAKVTFYNPLDNRNKAAGKGSRKYNHGLMVACHHYKEAKLKEMKEGIENKGNSFIDIRDYKFNA